MADQDLEDIELLLSPKDIQKKARKRRKRDGNLSSRSEGAVTMEWLDTSTSGELAGVPSYLSDHGLPSERARIAASRRYRELQRRGRERELATSDNSETTPLLTRESDLGGGAEAARQLSVKLEGGKESLSSGSLTRETANVSEVTRNERKNLKREKFWRVGRLVKIAVLTLLLVVSVILFSINNEQEKEIQIVTTSDTRATQLTYNHSQGWDHVAITLTGPFEDKSFSGNMTEEDCDDYLFFCSPHLNDSRRCSEISLHGDCQSVKLTDSLSSFTSSSSVTRDMPHSKGNDFQVEFSGAYSVSFQVSVRGELISNDMQVVLATVILVGVYLLITFDIVHRALAAFIGSTVTIAALSMLDKRPSLDEVVEWVDLDTICLLFGMMTLVAIFSQTGFFDYSAVKAYKLAKGRIGPLITILCLLSAVVSAFLDNVTTILLLTPVSIRLCQVLNVDPLPVLIAEVVFSNIGGTATAVGDPPNVIIVSNRVIHETYGIDFAEFTLHLFLGILLCMVVAYAVLACIYCTCVRLPNKDPPHIAELKREIAIWERTASQMPVVSLEETAVRDALRMKASEVRNQLQRERMLSVQTAQDMWQTNLAQLEKQYCITNPLLLAKSASVLLVVILLFFLTDLIPGVGLELGWIAVFGAVVLLVLSDTQDLEPILHKIEWSTLLFFAGLFVLMEGLQELGLIEFIGDSMVELIRKVPRDDQMTVAIVLVVWVSALASSFIDNIPFTTATIPVIVELAESQELCLSLRPLVWALAFGACLGGNGTLIGASANVVCAGIAEKNGYKISFVKFFSIGFPTMLATTFTAMIYLLIAHVAFGWDVNTSCS